MVCGSVINKYRILVRSFVARLGPRSQRPGNKNIGYLAKYPFDDGHKGGTRIARGKLASHEVLVCVLCNRHQ